MNKPITKLPGRIALLILLFVGVVHSALATQTYIRLNTYYQYLVDTDAEECTLYRYSLVRYDKDKDNMAAAFPESCPSEVNILGEFALTTVSNAAYNHNYRTTAISNGAFKYSVLNEYDRAKLISSIESVNIPNTILSIGDEAFNGCSHLNSIIVPGSVTSLGTSVFAGCTDLETATIDANIYSVPNNTFENCTALTSVVFTNPNVNSIGDCAFKNCTSLTDITFACNSLSIVFDSAFEGVNMSNVTVHVPLGCENNFAKLSQLGATVTGPEIPQAFTVDGIKYNVTSTNPLEVYVSTKQDQTRTTPVVIPANVTYDGFTFAVVGITYAAFDHCKHIPSITLPEGLRVIENSAFTWCESLTSLTIPSTVTTLGSEDPYGNGTFLGTLFDNSGITAITIPASVTTIGAGALYNMPHLTEATINANISEIPQMMFSGSNQLRTLHLNSPITSIGENAFNGVSLEQLTVTVPDGMTLSNFQALADLGVASITTTSGTQIYPEPELVTYTYYQVPSLNWLADGQQYTVGAAMNHDSFKTNGLIIPRFYNLNASNQAVLTSQADYTAFPESMHWTFKYDDAYHCENTNAAHVAGKTFHVGKEINGEMRYIVQAQTENGKGNGISGSSLSTLNLKNSYDQFTATEFVKIPSQTGFNDQQLFVQHVGWVANLNMFACRRAVNASGNFNRLSSQTDKSAFAYTNDAYTAMFVVYLVIPSDQLATAAAAIWQGLTEDDIAANGSGYTEEHVTNLRERALPDISGCTPSTLVAYLQTEYAKPIASEAAYRAADLDGKFIQIHHSYTIDGAQRTSAVHHVGNAVQTVASLKATASYWKAEYEESSDAVLLSFGDKYLGALPAADQTTGVAMTTNRSEAGRYRFYIFTEDASQLLLTCTYYTDGSEVTSFKEGTAANPGTANFNVTNNWLTDKCGSYAANINDNGSLTRWGSGAASSHWKLNIVNSEEEVLDLALNESLGVTQANEDIMAYAMSRINAHLTEDSNWAEKCDAYEQYGTHIFAETPQANKFYHIVSGLKFNDGNLKAITFDGDNLKWNTLTDADSFIWSLTPGTNGTYIMRSAVNGRYIAPMTSDTNCTLQNDESSVITFVRIRENDRQYTVRVSGGAFHAIGHGNGANATGNLSRYQTNGQIGNASSWYLIELTAEEEEALLATYREPYDETGLSGWVLTHMQNDIATINDPEASTNAKISAFLEMPTLSAEPNLEGKVFKIKASTREKYVKRGNAALNTNGNGNIGKLSMANLTQDSSDFLFFYTEDHKLMHLLSGDYLHGKLVITNEANAGTIDITYSSKYGTYKIHSFTGGSYYYSHDNGGTFDRCGSANLSDADPDGHLDTHSFYIVPATDADINNLVNAMAEPQIEATLQAIGLAYGTEPGNVTANEEATITPWATWKTTTSNMAHTLNSTNFTLEDYTKTKLNIALNYFTPTHVVVPAQAGRYYRLRASKKNLQTQGGSYNQLYLSTTSSNNKLQVTEEAGNNTIFLYTAANHLIGFDRGRFVINTGNYMNMPTEAAPESTEPSAHSACAFTFVPLNPGTTLGAAELGAFEINYNGHRAWHLSGTNSNTCGGETTDHYTHNLYIENVTELPVAVAESGYGSVVAPVALEIPVVDGYNFYTFTSAAKSFSFVQVAAEAPETVAANTPILVAGPAGTSVNLAIVYPTAAPAEVRAREGEQAAEESPMILAHGSHIASAHATTDEDLNDTYALTSAQVDGLKAGDVAFTKLAHGEELTAGTMHLTMPKKINEYMGEEIVNTNDQAVINLNQEYTTAIREIVGTTANGTETIYDLQGRRLNAPIRGINIINGRKVVVRR
ncbi:MAG: leucine-rich repeat domain-containing protein [Bacteroides sp.]|nr:leucine-rich repeat domain-containing protein [Bacteroides sp.]MCM1378629.1 leucine-rich repeat domain-containing protein [Bacteroides sp.]MCM1446397.1 leucine-rich repeat domain-containing protein [Prevotella sp.]